ncbi:hypothetical protein F4801DRAFT_439215 [Xylaria longipes]|nr:hypothetical protein F4801DRAFT_439215 [Xylaria longipes]
MNVCMSRSIVRFSLLALLVLSLQGARRPATQMALNVCPVCVRGTVCPLVDRKECRDHGVGKCRTTISRGLPRSVTLITQCNTINWCLAIRSE